MLKSTKSKILFATDDISISRTELSVPSGKYPLSDIRSVKLDTQKQLLGPVCMALIGTVILGLATDAYAARGDGLIDIGIGVFLLIAGIFWRVRGVQHLLVMKHESTLKEEPIWFTRRRDVAEEVLETLKTELARQEKRDEQEMSA